MTIAELEATIDRADEHTKMLMDSIEVLTAHRDSLERALVDNVEVDLQHRIEIESLKIKLDDIAMALEKSVKLQSHYAGLLNMHDGGKRLQFDNTEAWLFRLRELGELA